MKKNEWAGLRVKKTEDLRKMATAKREELYKLLSKVSGQGEKNIKKGRMLKREVAQILTLMKEKELL